MRELDRCDFCEEPADGVYEVVPGTVPGGARRLVLCVDCRDTLAGVVDPLLDALDGGPDDRPPEPSPAVTLEPGDEDGAGDSDNSGDGSAPENGGPEDDVTVDSDADERADGDTDERADADADERADTDADETDAAGGADESEGPDRPEGYAKLVRLLRNRPGAMTRADLAALADGAYDLSRAEVDAAVDAAVENGHLEETSEGVRTP